MNGNKPFTLQLVIVGGLLVFLYIFFSLALKIYHDYQLETDMNAFEEQVARLAEMARQKPLDIAYYQSEEYKDKYAKENLNLLNPGEKLFIIPEDDPVVKTEGDSGRLRRSDVLDLPLRNQWWEYFFGKTLSVPLPSSGDRNLRLDEKNSEPIPDARG